MVGCCMFKEGRKMRKKKKKRNLGKDFTPGALQLGK